MSTDFSDTELISDFSESHFIGVIKEKDRLGQVGKFLESKEKESMM